MRVPSGNIEAYKSAVSLGAMPDARVQATGIGLAGSAEAYGVQKGRAMEGVGDTLNKVASIQDKMQEDKIASDVVAAQSEYQKRLSDAMYSGDNALLSRNGENAANVDKDYQDIEKKIRTETLAKLPNFELAHKAFLRVADREAQNNFELINRHKLIEGEKTFKLSVSNGAATAVETTSRNYNNPVAIQTGLNRINELGAVMQGKYGKEAAEAFKREYISSLLNDTVAAAVAKQDYKAAEDLLDKHGDKMGDGAYTKWTAALTEKRAKNERLALVESLRNNPAFKDNNGFFDPQKAMEYVRAQKKTVGGNDYQAFKRSLLVQESGDYDQGANGLGATGAYQMLPATFKSGLRAAGLPEDSPWTKENQDAAADALLRPLFQKYGAEGAAVAWYAGDQNAPRFLAGQSLIGDSGGEYSADAKQDDGQGNMSAPSVREYAQQVTKRMRQMGGGATREEPMYDEETLSQLERQFQALHSEDIRKDNEQQHYAVRNVQDFLAANKDMPLDQKIDFINNAGLRPSQSEALSKGLINEARAEEKARITEMSKTAEGALELLDARDALTVSSVEALAGQMTSDAYLRYMAKATRAEKSDADKSNNAADKDWHAVIKNDPTFGNADQQNTLIGSISEILNVEHTEGSDRRVKATKLIAEAREKGKRDYIAGYSSRNNQAFLQMEELYPGASSLVRKGDKNVDGYEWIDILKRMSAQTYEDPAAAKAWNAIFNNRLPMTEKSFAELTEFYRREAEGGN